jgi:hypothetical protein
LKLYFPQILTWFDEVDSALVGVLLERWPTLEALQKARVDPALSARHEKDGSQGFFFWGLILKVCNT